MTERAAKRVRGAGALLMQASMFAVVALGAYAFLEQIENALSLALF